MKFLKIKHLKHSGQGENATHIQVMNKFRESKEVGMAFCKEKGFDAVINEAMLVVTQAGEYGFEFSALIQE